MSYLLTYILWPTCPAGGFLQLSSSHAVDAMYRGWRWYYTTHGIGLFVYINALIFDDEQTQSAVHHVIACIRAALCTS